MTCFVRALFLVTVLGNILSVEADACSVVIGHRQTASERRLEAQRVIHEATAIVDGEVIRPVNGREPALVRVSRVLKGPNLEVLQVGAHDSCDVALVDVGERLRLILVGGPDLYFLRVDNSNARYEDRILQSDRRRVWPYQPGATRPPPSAPADTPGQSRP